MNIQFFVELLGTVAFAISGAMLAVERKMDLFGVLFLGLVTATGGGFIRDVVLGKVPPGVFTTPVIVIVGFLSSLYTFFTIHTNQHLFPHLSEGRFQWILNLTDSIGLGLFSIAGVNVAIEEGYKEYHMFVIFLGMLTGVGGGMLRDIFAGLMPAILKKHIYACASLIGAFTYLIILEWFPRGFSMFVGSTIVVIIRMFAYHYKWNLPKAIQ